MLYCSCSVRSNTKDYTIALRCLIKGSSPRRVLSHFYLLLSSLLSPSVLGQCANRRTRADTMKKIVKAKNGLSGEEIE